MRDFIRILIIDGIPFVRDALAAELARIAEFEVVGVCASADQAWESLERLPVGVVITDLFVHPLGYAAPTNMVEFVERMTDRHDVGVLVWSSSESLGRIRSIMDAGARGFVSRRQPFADLVSAIHQVAHGHRTVSAHVAGELVAHTGAGLHRVSLRSAELDIIQRMALGQSDTEIARALFVSRRTIQNRLAGIRARTGLVRREAITRWAVENDLISPPN